MINLQNDIIQLENVHVHLIPSKKFKTVSVELNYKSPIDRNTVTKRALLPHVIKKGSKKYPTPALLQEKLDDLYGASFQMDGVKIGMFHILTISMEFANGKFIDDQSAMFNDAFAFLNDVVANPNVEGNAFDQSIVEREKETLQRQIQSIKDNKISYANMRLMDEMCQGAVHQIHAHGYKDDLVSINQESLYAYYQEMIVEDTVDLFVIGDFDSETLEAAIRRNMPDIFKTPQKRTDFLEEKPSKRTALSTPKEVIEKEPIQQAKLHVGYRTNTSYSDLDFAGMLVCNMILGGHSGSKLFVNVREKNSLAYYAVSTWDFFSDNLFVYSGIDPKNYRQARQIIEEQLTMIKDGGVSDAELEEAKTLLVSQYSAALDNANEMINLLYQQQLGHKARSPEQLINQIRQVQKDDVIRLANKVEEDTVFLLTSEEEQ